LSRLRLWRDADGFARAEAEQPFEVLGWYLHQDTRSLESLDQIREQVALAKSEQLTRPFAGVGDTIYLEIGNDGVLLQSEFAIPPAECRLSLQQFDTALRHWRRILANEISGAVVAVTPEGEEGLRSS
jgi:hypothetical protein